MNIIEVELGLEDGRFCDGCLLNARDYQGNPNGYCILYMNWSNVYHYVGISNDLDGEIITSREFLARFRNAYHVKDGWHQQCLRPQECKDRERKE